MKIKIIKDRNGRKYELHPAGLIERPYRNYYTRYILPRTELKRALCNEDVRVVKVLNGYDTTALTFMTKGKNQVAIGCRSFDSKNGRALKVWAKGIG